MEKRALFNRARVTDAASRYDHRAGNDDYSQAGDLYRQMAPHHRNQLLRSLVVSLKPAPTFIQIRQVRLFAKADAEYGRNVAADPRLDFQDPGRGEAASNDQR